ncbi:MAG: protein kinase, partial [Xanthomonadales bacterium]|nr:protein kinase [Xanthomonadales bacterium]
RGHPVLADFGIAKETETVSTLTALGLRSGTPAYMSPEHAGDTPMDNRSDLYSLGIVLYEMLTGKVPFRGNTPVAISRAHLEDPVPRLPEALSRYQPLMDRLLAKNPADRFQDAKALVEAIDRVSSGNFETTVGESRTPTAWVREASQRRVVRTAAIYGASAWLITEAGAMVAATYDWPDWVQKALVTAFVLGFPVVVFLAWLYDLGPGGIRRVGIGRSKQAFIAVLGGVALVSGVTAWIVLGSMRTDDPGAEPMAQVDEPAPATEPSLVVLPFESLSDAKDDRYFADGLTEELLSALAGVPGMKVAGRTSSFYYRDREATLQTIGEALGVSNVLTGSVRRAGDQLRITTQLIKIEDGFPLWAESYDRQLADIFAVQEEIARSVVSALHEELLVGAVTLTERSTGDPGLQQMYLVARGRIRSGNPSDLLEAERLLEEILRSEPDNAKAIAAMFRVQRDLHTQAAHTPWKTFYTESKKSLERAVEIAPDSSEVRSAHAQLLAYKIINDTGATYPGGPADALFENYLIPRDELEAAEREAELAVELDPESVEALSTLGFIRAVRQSDTFEGVLSLYDRALEIDPLARRVRLGRADIHFVYGRYENQLAGYRQLSRLHPDYAEVWIRRLLFEGAMRGGFKTDLMYAFAERARRINNVYREAYITAIIWWSLGMPEKAADLVLSAEGTEWSDRVSEWMAASLLGNDQAQHRIAVGLADQSEHPLWAFAAIFSSVQVDRPDRGMELLRQFFPELLGAEPKVDWLNIRILPLLAHFRMDAQLGDQAQQACKAGWAFLGSHPSRIRSRYWAYDMMCFAVLGETRRAIGVAKTAVDNGHLWFWVPEPWLMAKTLDRARILGPVLEHPEYVALMDRIRAHHMQYRDEILRMEREGLPPVSEVSD